MIPQENHDPLSELLNDTMLPLADPKVREAIYAATRPVLLQRRLIRHGLWTAAIAASYLVGAISVLGWQSLHRNEFAGQPVKNSSEVPGTESNPPPDARPTGSSSEIPGTIAVLETVEALSTFEKLRRAGDRQLNERGNLQGAIGCYRRALDFATDDDLQIVLERDSWLLIPLKETRLEARKHVHKKS